MAKSFPSIFLDTNILWNDNWKDVFDNKYTKGIKTYKNITKAQIYTSEAFEMELCQKEKERIEKTKWELEKISKRYPSYDFPKLDSENIISTYKKQIKDFFSKILSVNSVDIKECVRRAVEKIPPCSQTNEEFRDTVWWLSYLSILQRNEECVFISWDKHFRGCKSDHEKVKIYDSLYDFFKDFNEDFLEIKVWEDELLEVFPLDEIEEYTFYENWEIDDYVDASWTDFEVENNNEIHHINTEIICTEYDWSKYIFSFSIGFMCGFNMYDDRWENITEMILPEWVYEEISGIFTYENWNIVIDYGSIQSDIETESLYDTLKEMEADFHYDAWKEEQMLWRHS